MKSKQTLPAIQSPGSNAVNNKESLTSPHFFAKSVLGQFIKVALAGSVLSSGVAVAALQDHGGISDNSGATVNGTQITPATTLGWPAWYRDNNGLALGLCKSQLDSPSAPGASMCFPIEPRPTPDGFAGNVGDEIFYMNMGVNMAGGGMDLRYESALEAAYGTLNPVGAPLKGQELVFARVRFLMHVNTPECAGTYRIVHPWGEQTFPNVPQGKRALFATFDMPIGAPLDFDGALNGPLGPFLQWDDGNENPLPRTVANGLRLQPIGFPVQEFIGDPNVEHTFTGSPHMEMIDGTNTPRYINPTTGLPEHQNYVKVIAPVGCDLGGAPSPAGEGANVMKTNTAFLMGQVWNTPIPTPTQITTAQYTRSATNNTVSVDVWANSKPGQTITVTGSDLSGVKMTEEVVNADKSKYQAHIVLPATARVPPSVTAFNETSNPPLATEAALVDVVTISKADFNPSSGKLCVSAQSSDDQILTLTTSSGAIIGQLNNTNKPGCLPAATNDLTAELTFTADKNPPESVVVESSTFGSAKKPVTVLPNTPDNTAVLTATADTFANVSGGVSADLDVGLNDGARGQVVVVSQPSATVIDPVTGLSSVKIVGTATGLVGGHITFTPTPGASGDATLSYYFKDAAGNASNVVNVNLNILFASTPPTGVPDNFAVLRNGATPTNSFTANFAANDVFANGSPFNPATVQVVDSAGTAITSTARGNLAVDLATGRITYTPKVTVAAGSDVFWYTVNGSTPIRVDVVVQNAAETLTVTAPKLSKAGRFDLRFTTTWFGAPLTPTGTCYLTRVGTTTLATPLLIGSAPVDVTGAVQIQAQTPAPIATRQGYTISCKTSNSTTSRTATGTAP